MSEATITKKEILVQTAAEEFELAASVVIMDCRGLTVEEVIGSRKQLCDAGIEMKVIKSPTLSRAVKKVDLDDLDGVFIGPTTIAFNNGDVVTPAKIVNEFAKDIKALEVKGDIIEGKVSSVERITALAKLLNREGLLSMLLSVS